ncbi:MAG: hypothetical protein ACI9N9_002892, partial [Enterobacterales bacterium]
MKEQKYYDRDELIRDILNESRLCHEYIEDEKILNVFLADCLRATFKDVIEERRAPLLKDFDNAFILGVEH